MAKQNGIRKNGAVAARGRGRNVEVSTATEASSKLVKFGRQMFPKDAKVTPAQALVKAIRKLHPNLVDALTAEFLGESLDTVATTAE